MELADSIDRGGFTAGSIALGVALLLAGCTGIPAEGSAVSGSDRADGGTPTDIETDCGEVDTTCPESRPFAGAPCEDGLVCEFVEDAGKTIWTMTCIEGAWDAYASCEALPGGCQLIPPPGEACDTPFQGHVEAEVAIGPASEEAFQPFDEDEPVDIVWGAQGASMLFYRLRLTGPELPTCVATTVSLESPYFVDAIPGDGTVFLRCGQSLSIYSIIPYGNCVPEEDSFEATFKVRVHGVGETVQPIRIPMESLCGFGFEGRRR